jgi:hypothetical protein
MSETVPTGFCESQLSPYQNATAEETIRAATKRLQNAPPSEFTFSRIEAAIERSRLINSRPLALSKVCVYKTIIFVLGYFTSGQSLQSAALAQGVPIP